ncbi:acetylserotonin O-methyltransferase [Frankia sp. Cj3]|uniref:acetylserotonin O-methyltransferase n=1 Tax=Frankia sp. Cj3 TaxID=2880976 RepID=UPI0021073A2E|nr:acetylserotonin O-methyltransferase [Frankia sp. Cj3]
MLELANGFISFKTFSAALELELFTKLAGGTSMTVKEFAEAADLQGRPARLLLAACASLGLLEKSGDGYRNSALAEEYLVIGRPHYFGGFVRFCDRKLYENWHRVLDALQTNRPVTWDPEQQEGAFSTDDAVLMETFWDAMHSLAGATAGALDEVYDFGPHQRVLDVGGGSGGFVIQLCQRNPGLTATVFDLPHVRQIAEAKVAEAGLGDRIDVVAGDFQADPALPADFDVALLTSVLHDHDEAANRRLLDKAFTAAAPGGVVLVCELLLNDERTGPPAAALMGMNMLVGLPGGENYAESEYRGWLEDAGFTDVPVLRFDAAGANGAVVGRKPLAGELS